MRSSILSCAFIAFSAHTVHALNRRAPAHIAVTDNVLNLTTVPYAPHLLPPSSRHLLHRRDALSQAKRQFDPVASLDEPLVTLGGRIYMTDVTLGGQTYSLVIDTGSSDTWVVSSTFQCINPSTYSIIDTRYCGLASTYDPAKSSTWKSIPGYEFAVNYTGGEFLSGDLGTEVFGIGGISTGGSNGELQVRQTIGVVERGYWAGEGISSGLMGLAYPALVSGASRLKYQSVMFTLAKESPGPDIFSLAFNRPTPSNPSAGGQLAIGGIPNVSHDGNWVRVPIQPVAQDIYAYYSINIDGFDITTPPSTSSSSSSPPNPRPRPNTKKSHTTPMIIDSGTSLLYLPDQVTDHIASLFRPRATFNPYTGMYIVACDAAAPRVGIRIGGHTFYVHEDDLMNRGLGAVGGPGVGAGPGQCVLAAQRAGRGSLVLGDSWLKGVLVVFDVGRDLVRVVGREVY